MSRTTLSVALSAILLAAASTATSAAPRNVLYLVFDDLRPDLSMYSTKGMKTPNLQKLADGGLVFERAYCQQTVCAPSRMSFATGRRPASTKAWNFLRHFRQSECPSTPANRVLLRGSSAGLITRHPNGVSFNGTDGTVGSTGGSGQCCTDCSSTARCVGWNFVGSECTLLSSVTGTDAAACAPGALSPAACNSGRRGAMPTWTTLPQNFQQQGYLTLGLGKYFHDVNKGLGVQGDIRYPSGSGLPPQSDPLSWSNVSIQNRNYSLMQQEYGRFNQILQGCAFTGGESASNNDYSGGFGYVDAMDGCVGRGVEYCAVPDVPASGYVSPAQANALQNRTTPFCDYIAYNEAKKKLRFAAKAQREAALSSSSTAAAAKGFFLVVGIRRPHLTFRSPKPYSDMYPVEDVALPVQRTLDESIDPIAWTAFANLGGLDPHNVTNTEQQVKAARAGYYAAVSWADYCAGQVLDELDILGLAQDTAVVVHSDHGWHLGEYNMWEKRTLWENSAHVPLIMHVPWMKNAIGKRTSQIVELVDVYKTLCELMGVALPSNETYAIDGTSLVPLLHDPSGATGWAAKPGLTQYPRCPRQTDPKLDWEKDSCIHSTDRRDFGFMGYSMRHDHSDGSSYRFTMWPAWNGSSLQPDWSSVRSIELYNHSTPLSPGNSTSDFDLYENVNLANGGAPFWQPRKETALVRELTAVLKKAFGFDAEAGGRHVQKTDDDAGNAKGLVANALGAPQNLSDASKMNVCAWRSTYCNVLLDVPAACTGAGGSACPVLFCLHGFGGTNTKFASANSCGGAVHSRSFIGVYPRGDPLSSSHSGFGWNDGMSVNPNNTALRCAYNNFTCTLDPNDGLFFETMIRALRAAGATGHLYAFGQSNGADWVQRLGVNAGPKLPFAGIAPQSGQLNRLPPRSAAGPFNLNQPSSAGPRVAQLSIHGSADGTIAYGGGPKFRSPIFFMFAEPDSDAAWARHNGCSMRSIATSNVSSVFSCRNCNFNRCNATAGCRSGAAHAVGVATHHSYGGCPATAPVEWYEDFGAGHVGTSLLGGVSTIDVVVAFFEKVEKALLAEAASKLKTDDDDGAASAPASALVTIPGQGAVQGIQLPGCRLWQGIPFAAPPVGELRWQPPRPPQPWSGVRVSRVMPQCMQHTPGWRGFNVSEDCLYLNIFAPPTAPAALAPVMLWIHGGGFTGGDATQGHGLFNGSGFVESQNVVVVSMDYRLNAFGFLGSDKLRGSDGSTGNFGIQDQRAAMKWVQTNAHLFGGDKAKVAIFGCSAGAASVSVHYVAPRSKGLFAAAIAESGGFAPWASSSMQVAEMVFAAFAEALGCKPDDIACMRKANATAVRDAAGAQSVQQNGAIYNTFAPVADGVELKAEAWELARQGPAASANVPLILGSNRDEDSAKYFPHPSFKLNESALRSWVAQAMPPHAPKDAVDVVLKGYPRASFPVTSCCSPSYWAAMRISSDWTMVCPARRAARWLSSASNPVHLYNFQHVTDLGDPPAPFEFVPHASERAYVFRDTALWSAKDVKLGAPALAASFGSWWTNMARAGAPGVASGQPTWPVYTNATDLLAAIDVKTTIVPQFREERCDLWDKYLLLAYEGPAKSFKSDDETTLPNLEAGISAAQAIAALASAVASAAINAASDDDDDVKIEQAGECLHCTELKSVLAAKDAEIAEKNADSSR